MKARQAVRSLFIAGFLLPAVLLFGLFVVVPLLQSFQFSLYDWRGLSSQVRYAGWDNFRRLAEDEAYRRALANSMTLIVIGGLILPWLGVLVAHGLQGVSALNRSVRAVVLLPHILSMVVVAILFKFLYNPAFGLVDPALRAIGIATPASGILGDSRWALPAVAVGFLWYALGFYALIFAAGLQGISAEVREAAELDGATGLARFWRITWPLLWPVKRIAAVSVILNVMNLFALVQLMTEGTPDRRTEVLVRYMYEKAFVSGEMGYATAMGVANFVITLTLAGIVLFVLRHDPTVGRRSSGGPTLTLTLPPGLATTLASLGLGLLCAAIVLPLGWVVLTSFKDSTEIFRSPWGLPEGIRWASYTKAWTEASIGRYFQNTLLVTLATLALLIPVGAMAAYVIAKFRFRGRGLVFGMFLGGMTFPHFLVIVPLFMLMNQLGMLDTRVGLILVYVAYSLAFTVFVLTGFFSALPDELVEAAQIDGCGHARAFWRVMLPLARPGIVVAALFNAIGLWNEYGLAKVLLSTKENFTLSLGMDNLMMTQQYQADWGALFAGMVIMMLPVAVAYWIFRNRIYESMVAGSLKG